MRLNVFEVTEGQWSHDWADGECWSKEEAIKLATAMARVNNTTISIDFPLATQQRAKELGVNLAAKPDRAKLNKESDNYFTHRNRDPFGQY